MIRTNFIDFFCILLLFLIFVSKTSFSFLGIVPNQFSYFIYQSGMHPYMNLFMHAIATPICIWNSVKHKPICKLKTGYKILILALLFILVTQTIFQAFFVNTNQSILFQFMGLLMAVDLIGIYGVFIPLYLDKNKFIKILRNTSIIFTFISFSLLVCGFHVFKGGRFVGVFKHIPHMVSVSVIAFNFYFPKFYNFDRNRIFKIFLLIFLIFIIFLTATKTSLAAMLITFLLGIFIFPTSIYKKLLFKTSLLLSISSILLFLSGPISNLIYDVSTGQIELGYRKAQNGVQSRMEEAQRGYDMYLKSPLFGSGLLYKYFKNGNEDVEVDQYNSFKDPHNIFASSAVIGGFPLFLFSIFAVISMFIASINGIRSSCLNTKILSLYLLCHIPIIIIYHAHFSLGGIADRIYWLIFGYLGVREYS